MSDTGRYPMTKREKPKPAPLGKPVWRCPVCQISNWSHHPACGRCGEAKGEGK